MRLAHECRSCGNGIGHRHRRRRRRTVVRHRDAEGDLRWIGGRCRALGDGEISGNVVRRRGARVVRRIGIGCRAADRRRVRDGRR